MKDKCKWVCEFGEIDLVQTPYGFEMTDCINYQTGCGMDYTEIEEGVNEKFSYCPYCGELIEFEED